MSEPFASSVDAMTSQDAQSFAEFVQAQVENMAASGLDDRTYVVARLSALIALDAPVTSYLWVLNLAMAAGLTEEDVRGLVIALTPTVGYPRVLSAGEKMKAAIETLRGTG